MEHTRAVRSMLARAKKEREERREREEIAAAAEAWERDRDARDARDQQARHDLWRGLAEVVRVGQDEERAVAEFAKVRKDLDMYLAAAVGTGGATLLHLAVARGFFDLVEAILERAPGAGCNTDAEGQTALHYAAAVDSTGELVRLVAKTFAVADFQRADARGRTALRVAREWALPEAANALLEMEEQGAKMEEVEREAERAKNAEAAPKAQDVAAKFPGVGHMAGITAVREGRYGDALGLVREVTWVFVNTKDEARWSLLHHAASRGCAELCEALLEREDFAVSADVDKLEATALHIAAAGEKADCCQAIVSGGGCRFPGVNVQDAQRRTALHLAALRGSADCFEAIANHPDCHRGLPDLGGKTAPEYAVERGIDVEIPDVAQDGIEL